MIYLLVVVNGEFQNHYQILQIDEKATANEIKKAYRVKVMKGEYRHPDRGGDPEKVIINLKTKN